MSFSEEQIIFFSKARGWFLRSRDLPTEVGFVSQKELPPGRVLLGIVRENGELETTLDDSLNLYACILNDGPFSGKKLVNVGEAGALVAAAVASGIRVPEGFVFESAQVFFDGHEGLDVGEVRLSGFVSKKAGKRFEAWSTDKRPKLLAKDSGVIELHPDDKGRRHLSAKVLSTPRDRFLLSLRESSRELAPATAPTRTVVFEDGPTRVDKLALTVVSQLQELRWPRDASHVRSWQDIKTEELRYLESENRSAAVEQKWIVKTPNGGFALTEAGETRIKERWKNDYWFTQELKDKDRVTRRYLVRFVKSDTSKMEIRLSLYNDSTLLIQKNRESLEEKLREARLALDRGPKGVPFWEQEKEAARIELEDRLLNIQAVNDGMTLMKFLLEHFGAKGENPITVPMIKLRHVLGCDELTSKNGPDRVRGALEVLFRLHIDITLSDLRRRSTFVTGYDEKRAGPGASSDGDFRITLGELAIGGLRAFQTSPKPEGLFDFHKRLDAEQTKTLSEEPFWTSSSSLGAIYETTFKLSKEQALLKAWLEHNVTLNSDRTAGHRTDLRRPNDKTPRTYGSEFCPLLPSGARFVGALGHYKGNAQGGAERGRRLLQSRTTPSVTGKSGGREGGIFGVMGIKLPRGRGTEERLRRRREQLSWALELITGLVEDLYGGLAAVKHREDWHRLSDAQRVLSEQELLEEANLFFFLPLNWEEQWRQKYNLRQAERVAQRETSVLFRAVPKTAPRDPDTLPTKDRIASALRERGMSGTELAQKMGVSKMTVSKWRAGVKPRAEHEALLEAWLSEGRAPSSPKA